MIRASGHEHFNGSLVVPVFDEAGNVVELYGRKVTAKLRKGTPTHLYLPGPHRGVFNAEALAAGDEVILCESLIDAMTFWAAGFRHVTSSYAIEGFGDEHAEAFRRHGTTRVLIACEEVMTTTKPAGRRRFGSVRKLPSGRFQARYRDETGAEYAAPETFATKTAAA